MTKSFWFLPIYYYCLYFLFLFISYCLYLIFLSIYYCLYFNEGLNYSHVSNLLDRDSKENFFLLFLLNKIINFFPLYVDVTCARLNIVKNIRIEFRWQFEKLISSNMTLSYTARSKLTKFSMSVSKTSFQVNATSCYNNGWIDSNQTSVQVTNLLIVKTSLRNE